MFKRHGDETKRGASLWGLVLIDPRKLLDLLANGRLVGTE